MRKFETDVQLIKYEVLRDELKGDTGYVITFEELCAMVPRIRTKWINMQSSPWKPK
jgi:hypothetical protein